MYFKIDDRVYRPAAILAELKKLKVKEHIKALGDNKLLLELLDLVPIGDDKFIKVREYEPETDKQFALTSPLNEHCVMLDKQYHKKLSLLLGFEPIIGHDYRVFCIKAEFLLPELEETED